MTKALGLPFRIIRQSRTWLLYDAFDSPATAKETAQSLEQPGGSPESFPVKTLVADGGHEAGRLRYGVYLTKRDGRNPGAAWHEGMAKVAGRYRRSAPSEIERVFYAGVETAHRDSAGTARKMGLNPGPRLLGQATKRVIRRRGQKPYVYWEWIGLSPETGGTVLYHAPIKSGVGAKRFDDGVMIDMQTGDVFASNPGAAWHRKQAHEAGVMEERAARKGVRHLEDFYHGKEVAHRESQYMAEAEGLNPDRPHGTFRRCVRKVKRSLKQYGRTGDPFAICGAALSKNPLAKWTIVQGTTSRPRVLERHVQGKKQIIQKEARTWRFLEGVRSGKAWAYESIGTFPSLRAAQTSAEYTIKYLKNPLAVYNPPSVAGIIYNKAIEIRAQKTDRLAGRYRHVFGPNVKILGLDNGDVLLHHVKGKPLWISRKDYDRRRH